MSVLANEGAESVVGHFDPDNPERYIQAMAILAFQTGLIQVAFGAVGLGAVTSILSHPGMAHN